ncbi:FAD-dependent oxidoreductase [Chitinophaga horti]|uniref:FAD-dependent oxidoreductase n=1 Tax=Chitinophaga horti TaxID=2920382 RepID=A0ABY6J969_9BACT|nr:FAD-dependent oxidoreductase [Chitinophaga horti]UYQ94844.1 FAD-dependent oxidoreductase [Chitinophaga horti]
MGNQVIIIGGGIIGLSSAFYLQEAGYEVTVVDKTDMSNGCSYGNAGYICPSHFVPLAAPGIVAQGFKWMLNSKSPFYVQPRLNKELISWGLQFMKSANARHVQRSAIPLRDIALLSKNLYEEWTSVPGIDFAYEPKGMLEFFKDEASAHHAEHSVKASRDLGLDARLIGREEVQKMEPDAKLDILGAVYFACDSQLYPNKLMSSLQTYLAGKGVKFLHNTEVTGFVTNGERISGIKTPQETLTAAEVVLATGVWSGQLAKQLSLNIPMVGGRGYSVTLENSPYKLHHSIILSEARVAISPMDGNKLRFGGTMEITGIDAPPRMKRVQGILESVKKYLPEYDIAMPAEKDVWYGYRPCSADGLPHLGKTSRWKNLTVATGHSMLGISLGAATGKLVQEIVQGKPTSMDIRPFEVERF